MSCSSRSKPLRRSRSDSRTRRQATNPTSNLVDLENILSAELISATPRMSYCMLNYCTLLYCLPVQHSHFRGNGRVSRLSQGSGGIIYLCNTHTSGAMAGPPTSAEEVGEIITTVRLALRGFVRFFIFFFAEVRSGRMSSYDPRGWGHSC